MSDKPIRWLLEISIDNEMGLTIAAGWRGRFYRWHWRHPLRVERL